MFLRVLVVDLRTDVQEGLVIGALFFGIGGGIGLIAYLFNADYNAEITESYNPDEVELMYDDYEVVIKYGEDKRFEITDKKRYERVMDSCFYIEKTTYYDIFGSDEGSDYELITFESDKKDNGPVKIDL
jgi:hypothetical protein